MSTIHDLFQQAQLAVAAYADLWNAAFNRPYTANNDVQAALEAEGMATKQAAEFVKHWRVVSHQPDTSSGFSATLFERLDPNQPPTGQYTLAMGAA